MKKKFLIILLFLLFLIPIKVFGEENKFEAFFTGDNIASVGEEIEFSLEIDTNMDVNKLYASLKYDNNILELLKITTKDGWSYNTLQSELDFTNKSIKGKSTVAIVKFKVKSNNNKGNTYVSFEDIKVSSNEETPTIKTTEVNPILVKLRSDDNTVKSININNKKISGFSSSTYEYFLEVESSVETVNIYATLNDSKAYFVENFGSREESLEYGLNTFYVKSNSESNIEAVYKINIIRKDDRLVDNDLKSIIINSGDVKINFDKSVLSYTVKAYKLEELEIEAVSNDENAKVDIEYDKKIKIGENIVTIKVTAVTGDIKEYKIIVINNDVATDTRLKNLSIKGVSLEFDPDKSNYEVRYMDTFKNNFKLYATSISNDTEIKILNSESVKPGSQIKVIVSAIDGSSENVYIINIVKDNRINFFGLVEVIVLIILVILVLIQLKRKNKNKKIKEKVIDDLEKTKEIVF